MKFEVLRSSGLQRLGKLSCSRLNSKSFLTPGCFLYMRSGIVPYLTPDMLSYVFSLPCIFEITLPTVYNNLESVKHFPNNYRKYLGLPNETLLYLSQLDSSATLQTGFPSKDKISIWVPGGRRQLSVDEYTSIAQLLDVDMFASPSNFDRNDSKDSDNVHVSVSRSLKNAANALESCKSFNIEASMFTTVYAGNNRKNVDACLTQVSSEDPINVDTFGSHSMPSLEILRYISNSSSGCKLLSGVGTPLNVINAIKCGVDVFEGHFPYVATESKFALAFPLTLESSPSPAYISIKDKSLANDLSPLIKGCKCYTCARFSRAYIHHLEEVNEILYSILLMLHNLHHYFSFFETLRAYVTTEKLDIYSTIIANSIETSECSLSEVVAKD